MDKVFSKTCWLNYISIATTPTLLEYIQDKYRYVRIFQIVMAFKLKVIGLEKDHILDTPIQWEIHRNQDYFLLS